MKKNCVKCTKSRVEMASKRKQKVFCKIIEMVVQPERAVGCHAFKAKEDNDELGIF